MRSHAPLRRIAALALPLTLAAALALPHPAWPQCATKPGRAFDGGRRVTAAPALVHMPVVADFDGDGLDDYAAHDGHYSRRYETTGAKTSPVNIGVYLSRINRGVPTVFAPPLVNTVGEETHCYNCAEEVDLQAEDVNNDGFPDLIVSISASDAVYVLLNKADGSGTFELPVRYPVGKNPVWVRVGDFDGDGIVDLATVNLERVLSPNPDRWSLSFLHGSTDPRTWGTFSAHADLPLSDDARLGPTDDNTHSPYERFNTDLSVLQTGGGDLLATGDRVHGLRFWNVVGTTFQEIGFKGTGLGVGQVVFGAFDLTGDGFPELLGPGSLALTLDLLRAPDAATFAAANRLLADLLTANAPTWGPLEHVRFADVDHDGAVDAMAVFQNVVIVGFGASPAIHPFADFAGNGVQYLRIYDIAPSGPPFEPGFLPAVFGDFNGDGFLDILAGGDTLISKPATVKVYFNRGFPQLERPALEVVLPSPQLEARTVTLNGAHFVTASPLAAVFHVLGVPGPTLIVPLGAAQIVSDTNASVDVPLLGDLAFWNTQPGGPWGHGTADVHVSLKNDCSRSAEVFLQVLEDRGLH